MKPEDISELRRLIEVHATVNTSSSAETLGDFVQNHAAAILTALSASSNDVLRYPLDYLARAEANYRSAHDLLGAADIRTGQAWDKMRKAGDIARAALSTTPGGSNE